MQWAHRRVAVFVSFSTHGPGSFAQWSPGDKSDMDLRPLCPPLWSTRFIGGMSRPGAPGVGMGRGRAEGSPRNACCLMSWVFRKADASSVFPLAQND